MTISGARALIEAAKADGVTMSLAAGGTMVSIIGPAAVRDGYVAAVKAAKPWVRAALRPNDPSPEHICIVCGGAARFGFYAKERRDDRWACLEHRGQGGEALHLPRLLHTAGPIAK